MTSSDRDRSSTGFTLLELLAALAILGLLLAEMSQGVRLGLLAVGTANRLNNGADDLELVDSTLRRVIEGLDPGDDPDPAPFVGTDGRLECITTMPGDGLAPDRHMRASLFVDGAHRLILRWRPYLRATRLQPPPAPVDSELLSKVLRIDFAFWRHGSGWASVWRSPDLPTLVRIRLTFPPGDPHYWPEIVAAPLLNRP
jgi:general secretion pathway protein J